MNDSIDRRFDPGRREPGDPFGERRPGRTPEGFAPHDVIATYATMAIARQVVQALQMAGIDASQISLYGPAADEAAADLDVRVADEAFARTMWRRTWVGSVIGAVAGSVLGGVIAAIVLREAGSAAIGVFWAAVAGTAVLGLGTGAATGATSSAQMSRAWELTFHDVTPGEVGVAVHSERPAEAKRAWEILTRHEPRQLERFDTDVSPEELRGGT